MTLGSARERAAPGGSGPEIADLLTDRRHADCAMVATVRLELDIYEALVDGAAPEDRPAKRLSADQRSL